MATTNANPNHLSLPFLLFQKIPLPFSSPPPIAQFTRLLNNQTFDLVILDELFGVHSFAIALHLNHFRAVPYVIYSTTMMIQSTAYALALGKAGQRGMGVFDNGFSFIVKESFLGIFFVGNTSSSNILVYHLSSKIKFKKIRLSF